MTTNDLQLQIDLTRDQIAAHEREAAALRAECGELERDLNEFQARYDKIIKPMQTRLEVIRSAIDDLQKEGHRTSGTFYEPDYESVEQQYKRIWTKPDFEPDVFDHLRRPPSSRIETEPPDSDTLKRLYRDLARRFHPDLATDDADRAHRTHIMSQINAAYSAGDVNALKAISADPAGAADQPLLALTLRTLKEQLEAVDHQVSMLRRERDEMLYGAMMKLKLDEKLARIKGRDLLREMRSDMEREYDVLLVRLDKLRAGS